MASDRPADVESEVREILAGCPPYYENLTELARLVDSLAYIAPDPWDIEFARMEGDWETLTAVYQELRRLERPIPPVLLPWLDEVVAKAGITPRSGRNRNPTMDAQIARAFEELCDRGWTGRQADRR